MCDQACIDFGLNLTEDMVKGKKVIDVGSCDINGSLRGVLTAMNPSSYLGCDIVPGYGVDIICPAEKLAEFFMPEYFDVVVSTEMLEHVQNWKQAIQNMKHVCKIGGYILITTRSKGFGKHNHPYDFWRFEEADMRYIFRDCEIIKTEKDIYAPGIFILAKKLTNDQCSLDIEVFNVA